MVAPFTPYNKVISRQTYVTLPWGTPYEITSRWEGRSGVKQKPPFVDTDYRVLVTKLESWGMLTDASSGGVNSEGTDYDVEATNMARAKFVGKLGDSSSFGATLTAELRSTWGTVVSGLTNAALAANAVRRGDLIRAATILGFRPPVVNRTVRRSTTTKSGRTKYRSIKRTYWVMPGGKHVAKSLGNKWLWYSYGVKPLVQDIYNGMDVLTRPAPEMKVSGSGSASGSQNVGGFYSTRYDFRSSVRISAYVRVSNPNLWLANQLGLLNPVQWFNEAISFSFVVDWFSNLSQVIMQMTDFAGLEITRPCTTSKHLGITHMLHPDYGMTHRVRQEVFTRKLVIPQARLKFAYERFQWQRGLNAISLLVQGFGRTKY